MGVRMRLRFAVLLAMLSTACSLVSVPAAAPGTLTPSPIPSTSAPGQAAPATPTSSASAPPTPVVDWSSDSLQAQALLKDFAADALSFPSATRYWIEASVTLDAMFTQAVIEGRERIRFTNPIDRPLEEVVLMLWPNDDQYAADMQAGPAVVYGSAVTLEAELEGVGLRVPLQEPLEPGQAVDLTIPFRVVTTELITAFTPKRFGISQGMLLAPTFYPLVPRLTADRTWQVMAAPPGGDTTNSDVAFYDVHLTIPEDQVLVATGIELEREPGADRTTIVHYASGPVRDFAFALGPFAEARAQVGDVVARAWVLPEHAGEAEQTAAVAARALQVYSDWIGPYPYDELDVIDAPAAFGGIEYPGLIFIGVVGDRAADGVVVHEVAHQWFYGLIGNDQLLEPWLDEGAASYLELLYYETAVDVRTAIGLLDEDRLILRSMGRADTPIGMPVGWYESENDYAVFVYLKGALFFDALRSELGETGFRSFLRTYFEEQRYGFASARDFQATAEATCLCDLGDLFDLWVYNGGPLPIP
jgi:hypothetical protein